MTDYAKSPRVQAAERGETTYQGAPCKRAHDGTRFTIDGQCVACCRTRSKARAAAIRQRLAAGRAAAQERS